MLKPGREFEEAIWAFVQTLDPLAEVLFNHKVPDRDTGTLRQCDVWINAKFGGHWPLSILVSCKDHNRKLNISDIGTFHDEVRSTGASTGVIYGRKGFTKQALNKAKANGLSCCRLYQNEPADIPTSIWFESFACTPKIRLTLKSPIPDQNIKRWNDIFNLGFLNDTVLDVIVDAFHKFEGEAVEETKSTGQFPKDWNAEVEFSSTDCTDVKLNIQISGAWRRYRGRFEATLLNGSYCFSNELFHGSQATPWIDTQGEHPGEGWVEIIDQDITLPTKRVITVLYKGNIKAVLSEKLGPKLVS